MQRCDILLLTEDTSKTYWTCVDNDSGFSLEVVVMLGH